MKDAIYATFREIVDAWLGQWFTPREDYEWLRQRARNIESRVEEERQNHERLIEQRAADMVVIEDLKNQLVDCRQFIATVISSTHPGQSHHGENLHRLARDLMTKTKFSKL